MFAYIIRRILYAIPVLIGVNLITFALFFMVNSPDDMARAHLGQKYVTQAEVQRWKGQHGYNTPLFYNAQESGAKKVTDTLFFNKSVELFVFNFGVSDGGRDISYDISQRMWASLAIAVPILIIGVLVDITFALLMVLFRSTYFDALGVVLCVLLM